MSNPGSPPGGGPLLAIGELAELADRKLPEITAQIERSMLVRDWLESAARCECPNLNECPLFDDPPLDAAPRQQPRSRTRSSPGPNRRP